MTDVVLATTKTMRTLADGGMTVTLDIAPQHFEEAFRLFGRAGSTVGVAAITTEAARKATVEAASDVAHRVRDDEINEAAKPELRTKRCAVLCGQSDFWAFLERQAGVAIGGVENADDAAEAVRYLCGVPSRAYFNRDEEAGKRWDALEAEYLAWAHGRR